LRRLTLRQVTDMLLLPRPGSGRVTPAAAGNGLAIGELPGPPSREKELKDLERVKKMLGRMLTTESYERAKQKIEEKYGGGR